MASCRKHSRRAHKSAFVCEGIECGFNIVKRCDELFVHEQPTSGVGFLPESERPTPAHSPHTIRSADASSMPLELLAMQV